MSKSDLEAYKGSYEIMRKEVAKDSRRIPNRKIWEKLNWIEMLFNDIDGELDKEIKVMEHAEAKDA
jgi:hypothetical protein